MSCSCDNLCIECGDYAVYVCSDYEELDDDNYLEIAYCRFCKKCNHCVNEMMIVHNQDQLEYEKYEEQEKIKREKYLDQQRICEHCNTTKTNRDFYGSVSSNFCKICYDNVEILYLRATGRIQLDTSI